VLADGEVVIIGGMNFANRYHGSESKKEWLDFAVLFKGPECTYARHSEEVSLNIYIKDERSHETVANPVSS
jgi:cardiolipin synthase